MSKFKVGDQVIIQGVVTKIDNDKNYPILVKFNIEEFSFTGGGLYSQNGDSMQLQHLSEILPKVGEECEFSNDEKEWYKGKLEGFHTDITSYNAKFIRPIVKPILTPEEKKFLKMAKKLGYNVNKK